MDVENAVDVVKNFIQAHLKNMNYFNEPDDHCNRLELKEVTVSGDKIKVLYVIGEMWSVHDPSLRKVGRLAIETLIEAKPALKEIEINYDFTQ